MTDTNDCGPGLIRCLPPELFKSLSDPNRVAILARVAEHAGEMSVGEVASCCAIDLSVVSRHLRTLRESGILAAEKRGKQVFYRARFTELISLLRNLADALEQCCPETVCPAGARPIRADNSGEIEPTIDRQGE